MAEEVKEVENKADADAGEKLDKVLAHLDSVMSACDSLSKRMDSFEEEKKTKADAEEKAKEEADKKADEGKDPPEDEKAAQLAADKAKKDAEEEAAVMADKKRKDAEKEEADKKADSEDIRKMISDLEAKLPRVMTDAEHAAMADAQAEADTVFNAFGKRAPRPLDGETFPRYRRRLAGALKGYSPTWKEVDVGAVVQDSMFEIAKKQIYADALAAAHNPPDVGDELRAITSVDQNTGVRMTRFVGNHSFVRDFKAPTRLVKINRYPDKAL